jgi:hypothetical protein
MDDKQTAPRNTAPEELPRDDEGPGSASQEITDDNKLPTQKIVPEMTVLLSTSQEDQGQQSVPEVSPWDAFRKRAREEKEHIHEMRKKWRQEQYTHEYIKNCVVLPTISGAEHHPPILKLKEVAPPKPYPPQPKPLRPRVTLVGIVRDLVNTETNTWTEFTDQDPPTLKTEWPPVVGFSCNPFTETDIKQMKVDLQSMISDFLDNLLIIVDTDITSAIEEFVKILIEFRQKLITTMLDNIKVMPAHISRIQKNDLRFNVKNLFKKSISLLLKARDVQMGPDNLNLKNKMDYVVDALYKLTFVAKPDFYLNPSSYTTH